MKLSSVIALVAVAVILFLIDPVILGAIVFGIPLITGAAFLFERLFGPRRAK